MTTIPTGPLRTLGTYTMGEDVHIADVHVSFGDLEILHGVSVDIPAGRTLALVGESGSGKSTLALTVARLLEPGLATTSGTAHIGQAEMLGLTGSVLRRARSRVVAYLAQDASVALNPLIPVGAQIAEAYRVRERIGRREARERALEGLVDVGMREPRRIYRQYPHQLSGGMRQRVMIAIALALRPSLLVADEPTTALDVTVQREILDLVARLQREYELTVLWITHDFAVVAEIADDVAVMQDGRIVEAGTVHQIFDAPAHEYTKSLLASFAASRTASSKSERTAVLMTGAIAVVATGTTTATPEEDA